MSCGFRRFGLRLLGPMPLLKLQRLACVLDVSLPLVDEKEEHGLRSAGFSPFPRSFCSGT